jgi:hypothetical protein
MRNVLLSLIVLLSVTANASGWQKIQECENGNLVIDRDDQGYKGGRGYGNYQLVVRGRAVDYLLSQGAISLRDVNTKQELVLNIFRYDGQFISFRGLNQGVQIRYWIINDNGNIKLIAERDDRTGGPRGELANWYFRNCYYN